MITTDQIPPGWHPNMSETEVGESLLGFIRDGKHMDFVTGFLEMKPEWSVEWLVDMVCTQNEPAQTIGRLLRLIPRIEGKLTQSQMNRLNEISARHESPHVDSLIVGLFNQNNYRHPVDGLYDEFAKNFLKSKKR